MSKMMDKKMTTLPNSNKLIAGVKILTTSLLPFGFLGIGCGNFDKNPVPSEQGVSLNDLRTHAKDLNQRGPEKPRVITETVIVEKPQVVVREESSIDEKFIIISPEPSMTFNEGQSSSFKVRAQVLIPGAQIKLKAQGLPEGATFTASTSEKGLYILAWAPDFYTLPPNDNMKMITVKIIADISTTAKSLAAAQIQGLTREKNIDLVVFRNQHAPSQLTIENLPSEITEGEIIKFSVISTVPDIDGRTPFLPMINIYSDQMNSLSGSNIKELDGSRHVLTDPSQKSVEYVGNSKWKFNRIFDTKNIPLQPQVSQNNEPAKKADITNLRLSFKVSSPNGRAGPETLVQLKVHHLESKTDNAPEANLVGQPETLPEPKPENKTEGKPKPKTVPKPVKGNRK